MFQNRIFFIAEIGANHGGSLNAAFSLITAARNAGASAVKFQTYTPEEIAADVVIPSGPWAGRSYHDLYREAMTPWEWHEKLFAYARSLGLIPFSSPFSVEAIQRLKSICCPMYKIASPEISHFPLINAAAKTGKPLIISTGTADHIDVVRDAVWCAEDAGATEIYLLHCISQYPTPVANSCLSTLEHLRSFSYSVGISDHSLGSTVPVAAVALGARIIEKHFKLDDFMETPDSAFSMTPSEFSFMVDQCNAVLASLQTESFSVHGDQQYMRSLWLKKDISEGEELTEDHIAILRPNYGLPVSCLVKVIGSKVSRNLKAGSPLKIGDLWNTTNLL